MNEEVPQASTERRVRGRLPECINFPGKSGHSHFTGKLDLVADTFPSFPFRFWRINKGYNGAEFT